jgi:hypothetical protein
VAAFLGREARRSRHFPASAAEEEAMLVHNWCAAFTGAGNASDAGDTAWARFDQVFFFPPWGGESEGGGRA